MTTLQDADEPRYGIDLDPELRSGIEAAAREREMSVRDFVAAVLRAALADNGSDSAWAASAEWSRLSIPSFARDWESDADAIYDHLA